MKVSRELFKITAVVLACSVLIIVVSCKPEGNRALDSKTGAFVSPVQTPPAATAFVSPIQTPLPSVTSVAVTPTRSPRPITPEPSVTATPALDPLVIYDPVNRFSLRLLPGWRAAVGGTTVIINYDDTNLGSEGNFPPGAVKIQIGIGRLEQGQSFEQWLSNWISVSVAAPPDSGLPPITATAPELYAVGHYEGVTYLLNNQPRIKEIVLPLDDGRIITIGLTPADSPALPEALSILSTLDVSPEAPLRP